MTKTPLGNIFVTVQWSLLRFQTSLRRLFAVNTSRNGNSIPSYRYKNNYQIFLSKRKICSLCQYTTIIDYRNLLTKSLNILKAFRVRNRFPKLKMIHSSSTFEAFRVMNSHSPHCCDVGAFDE